MSGEHGAWQNRVQADSADRSQRALLMSVRMVRVLFIVLTILSIVYYTPGMWVRMFEYILS